MLESDIRGFLIEDENITSLIGSRIYPGWIPENAPLPSVAYLSVSGMRHNNIDVAYPRYQFSVFSTKYIEAKKIVEGIKKRLNGAKGTIGDSNVINIVFENSVDQYEHDTKIYHISLDFKIIYKE